MNTRVKLSVFFEEPFWVGLFERTTGDKYQVFRHVFGAEPRDCEVYEFIQSFYGRLSYSNPIQAELHEEKHINPKRLQRRISRELEKTGTCTRAQNAIKLQYEENKAERKASSREKKELEERRKFELRQMKKKEKKRGH